MENRESIYIIRNKMKKIFILAVAAMAMTSCSTVLNTASVNDVDNKILAGAVADLEVSPSA